MLMRLAKAPPSDVVHHGERLAVRRVRGTPRPTANNAVCGAPGLSTIMTMRVGPAGCRWRRIAGAAGVAPCCRNIFWPASPRRPRVTSPTKTSAEFFGRVARLVEARCRSRERGHAFHRSVTAFAVGLVAKQQLRCHAQRHALHVVGFLRDAHQPLLAVAVHIVGAKAGCWLHRPADPFASFTCVVSSVIATVPSSVVGAVLMVAPIRSWSPASFLQVARLSAFAQHDRGEARPGPACRWDCLRCLRSDTTSAVSTGRV